jgi:hypothetical protein
MQTDTWGAQHVPPNTTDEAFAAAPPPLSIAAPLEPRAITPAATARNTTPTLVLVFTAIFVRVETQRLEWRIQTLVIFFLTYGLWESRSNNAALHSQYGSLRPVRLR